MSELMVLDAATEIVQHPDAPYELDDDEAAEWRAQVAAMPADHFTRNTFPLLVQLCRHTVASHRLKQLEEKIMKPAKGSKFDMLAFKETRKMQSLETSQINRLLRSMRLTQQSTSRPETLGRKLRSGSHLITRPPWDDDCDDN